MSYHIVQFMFVTALIVGGKAYTCDPPCYDGNECTKDYCEPSLGVCLYLPYIPPPEGCCVDDSHCSGASGPRCYVFRCNDYVCEAVWDEELCGPVEYSSPSTLSENESSAIVLDDDDYQTPAINSGCGQNEELWTPGQIAAPEMPTCCWRNTSTCCVKDGEVLASTPSSQLFETLFQSFMAVEWSIECFLAYADLACVSCSPNTRQFATTLSLPSGDLQTSRVCRSSCHWLYAQCKDGNGWNWDRDTFCTTETSPLWPYVIADENCWENSDLEQMQAYGKSCLPSSIAGEI